MAKHRQPGGAVADGSGVSQRSYVKQEVPDCLLLMQVGACMQVMDQDARTVSQVTGLNLQMAGEVDDPVVLGGFPRSGLDAYVGKLVRAGHSVAVAVQAGDNERRLAEVIQVRCGMPAGRATRTRTTTPPRDHPDHTRPGYGMLCRLRGSSGSAGHHMPIRAYR